MTSVRDRVVCWLTGHLPMQVIPRDADGNRVPHRVELHCFRCGRRLDNGSVLFAPVVEFHDVTPDDDDDVAEANASR